MNSFFDSQFSGTKNFNFNNNLDENINANINKSNIFPLEDNISNINSLKDNTLFASRKEKTYI